MFAFCPVPLSIPVHRRGFTESPIPSAGPYYITSIQGDRTVLERNPYYPGKRPRHAERIVYTNDIPTPKAIVLADGGAVDLLPQDFDNTTPLFGPGGLLDRAEGPGERSGPGRKAAVLPICSTASGHDRLQHSASPLSRRASAPSRELRARPPCTRSGIRRRASDASCHLRYRVPL